MMLVGPSPPFFTIPIRVEPTGDLGLAHDNHMGIVSTTVCGHLLMASCRMRDLAHEAVSLMQSALTLRAAVLRGDVDVGPLEDKP